ncbi:MAG: MarC family protein [Acidimicrobiia bacterium]
MEVLLAAAGGTFAALLPITNPIGGAAVFSTLTGSDDAAARRRQARLTSIYVLGILAVSLLAGRPILEFFGIDVGVLKVAGGLVVAHTAWGMVVNTGGRITPEEHDEGVTKADVSFSPMAMPLIAGPGAIGIVIGIATISDSWEHTTGALVGVVAIAVVAWLCLIVGDTVLDRLGATGLGALTRILGFLILAIAVQLVVDGIYTILDKPVPGPFS